MNCTEFSTLLTGYVDETLSAAEREAVELHASGCASCHEFLQDVTGAMQVLRSAEEVEPPQDLVTRIAYLAPAGRTRDPLDRPGLLSRIGAKWFQPLLQPRFAMGMAMTVLSFAMLERCTGVQVQHIQAADLNPVRVWDGVMTKALRTKDRAVKYYENIRLVYEIESRVKELEAQQDAAEPRTTAAGKGTGNSQAPNPGAGRDEREGTRK